MQKFTLKSLKQVLPHFYANKQSIYLWGKPSTGKTSIIRQFAQEEAKKLNLEYSEDKYGPNYFTCKVITMSQYDAPDLRGMPVISKDENGIGITQFLATEELPRIGQGIIFFDELNLADESVRASIYSYILEGRISNLPRINSYWRVAASNSENDFCSVNTTSLGLLSRFAHLEVEPSVDEIVNFFLEKEIDSRIVGYLKNFPEDAFPKVWDERLLETKANPFPRQWEALGKLIRKDLKDINLIQDLAGACVGPETASRFVAFCKTSSLIDIYSIIENPNKLTEFLESKDRTSLFYAVISNLASLWFARDKKLNGLKMTKILLKLMNLKLAEFAVALIMMILEKRSQELVKYSEFEDLLTSLGVYFQ